MAIIYIFLTSLNLLSIANTILTIKADKKEECQSLDRKKTLNN